MTHDTQDIANLIATYAFLVDDGRFAELGDLLADAEFTLGTTTVHGPREIEELAHRVLRTFDDGTPRTRHVTTNVLIEIDPENHDTARSRSYYTVLQQTPDFPLQPIACGHYRDRFERRDGAWRFVRRVVTTDLGGDLSHHVKTAR